MLIGFTIILDNNSHNFIRKTQLDLNQKLGYRISRQSPHITIKTPFEVENVAPFITYFDELAKETKPFNIRLNGFNHFAEKVLFLDVEENEKLHALHWRILTDLKGQFNIAPHEFEGKNIKFHASIAGYNNPTDFKKANQYLKKYQPDFTFQANTLGVFYYLGNDGWIVLKKISLKG